MLPDKLVQVAANGRLIEIEDGVRQWRAYREDDPARRKKRMSEML